MGVEALDEPELFTLLSFAVLRGTSVIARRHGQAAMPRTGSSMEGCAAAAGGWLRRLRGVAEGVYAPLQRCSLDQFSLNGLVLRTSEDCALCMRWLRPLRGVFFADRAPKAAPAPERV